MGIDRKNLTTGCTGKGAQAKPLKLELDTTNSITADSLNFPPSPPTATMVSANCGGGDQSPFLEFSPTKSARRASTGSANGNANANAVNRTRHKTGGTSYADLITKAILSSKEARMSLSQIYDWMADNVQGLKAQRSLHSSKGWKNAVRHTLSINPRFRRVERQGRPGLWMVESHNVGQRVQQAVSPGGSPVDASYLVYAENGCLESDSFRLTVGSAPAYSYACRSSDDDSSGGKTSTASPTSSSTSPAFEFNVQTINVFHDDGSLGFINLPNPVNLKGKSKCEAGTQTSNANDHQNHQQQQLQQRPYDECLPSVPIYQQTYVNLSNDDCDTKLGLFSPTTAESNFLSLPDDLQDISIDPSLDCDVLSNKYWF